MNYLFVSGMFRSGSTLTAKVMDAHPQISFASDPFRPFFNDFRDALAEENGILAHQAKYAPLNDYYFDAEQIRMMKIIQQATFDVPLRQERVPLLREMIRQKALLTSFLIAEKVDKLKGRTYREFYDSMMRTVIDCYGKSGARYVGTKEVWCTEFATALLSSYPGSKAILLIRDPRAVIASFNSTGKKYPWLFHIRQWRKLATLTHSLSNDPRFRGRVMVSRYEDFVASPLDASKRICDFLGVDHTPDMVDGKNFRDGKGERWTQNSSYGTSDQITLQFHEKWRDVLNEKELQLIEKLCFSEMKLFGYEPASVSTGEVTLEDVWRPLIVPMGELADWIKPFSNCDFLHNVGEMLKEYGRSRLLWANDAADHAVSPEVLEAFFLGQECFRAAKQAAAVLK